MQTKILLAMDDSDSALGAAALVAKNFHPDSRVTLFSVGVDTATAFQRESPALSPHFKARQGQFFDLEKKKRGRVERAVDMARQTLLDAGFQADQVVIKFVPQKMGVARDILFEARTGYDLIVMGRRGPGSVKDFFSGSISTRVFNYAKDVAILIAP